MVIYKNNIKEKTILNLDSYIKSWNGRKEFLEGFCYAFASILKEKFDGEIWYNTIMNHFVCKIEDKFYDVNGEYNTDDKLYSWDEYQEMEPIHSYRITHQCIIKDWK